MKVITVVGSGVMGKGIAYSCAISGYKVYLHDINKEILETAKQEIYSLLGKGLQKNLITEEQFIKAKDNLHFEVDLKQAAKMLI